MSDIVERLRVAPTVILDHHQVEQGAKVRQMMVERAEAADLIERQAAEIDDLARRLISGSEHDLRERIRLQAEIERLRAFVWDMGLAEEFERTALIERPAQRSDDPAKT